MRGNKYGDIVGLTLDQRLRGEKRPASDVIAVVKKHRRAKKKVDPDAVVKSDPAEKTVVDVVEKKQKRKRKKTLKKTEVEPKPIDSESSDSELSDGHQVDGSPPLKKPKKIEEKKPMEKPKSVGEKLKERLKGSHFRYLNEQLYKSTSEEAVKLFQDDPAAFQAYHQGFTEQSANWPVNPLDLIIDDLNKKSKKLIVADIGCGDAKLARSVEQNVYSFDLFAVNDDVTVANMTNLPLEDASVDVCVFCLSLMNSDVADILVEAKRVLKKGGSLRIAEILSRFYSVKNFRRSVEKLGFRLVKRKSPNDMFILFDFEKMKDMTTAKDPAGLHLKPCLYKKR